MTRNTYLEDKKNAPFPFALRKLMERNGTTQEDLAKVTGKTRQTVSQYTNGISEPGYETLVKIADFFNVSVDYLLGRTQDPNRLPCAADELGLSSAALAVLKKQSSPIDSFNLEGLNLLLEHEQLLSLAGDIMFFRAEITERIAASESNMKSSRIESLLFEAEKIKRASEEHYLEAILNHELLELIESKFPEHLGCSFKILVGDHLLASKKSAIVDSFDEILRQVTNYNEFQEKCNVHKDSSL